MAINENCASSFRSPESLPFQLRLATFSKEIITALTYLIRINYEILKRLC